MSSHSLLRSGGSQGYTPRAQAGSKRCNKGRGGVPERSNGAVLKTADVHASVGSNPTPAAQPCGFAVFPPVVSDGLSARFYRLFTPAGAKYALGVSMPTAAARRIAPGFLQAKPRPLSAVADYVNGSILPPAVVCEVGWVNGLGAIRSLGRAGVRTVALDHRPWALGFRSRYALPVVAPDPLADQDGFISSLLALAEVLGRPAPIFPTHDEHLNALACRRDDLGDRFLYPFPSWDVLEPIQSKRHQLATASSLGLGTPATTHPRSLEEAQMDAAEIGFPVFAKPSENIAFKRLHKRQGFLCREPRNRGRDRMVDHEPMAQEFIPGGDECLWSLGTYISPGGEPLAPFRGGSSARPPETWAARVSARGSGR